MMAFLRVVISLLLLSLSPMAAAGDLMEHMAPEVCHEESCHDSAALMCAGGCLAMSCCAVLYPANVVLITKVPVVVMPQRLHVRALPEQSHIDLPPPKNLPYIS